MSGTANGFARVAPETKEQFDAELLKGMENIENGRVFSADEVEAEIRKMYNL